MFGPTHHKLNIFTTSIEPKGSVTPQWSAVQGTEGLATVQQRPEMMQEKIIRIHCPRFLTLLQGHEALWQVHRAGGEEKSERIDLSKTDEYT